jgi:hypothetical protein
MQLTQYELPMSQEPTSGFATMTFDALAERLSDGPLRTLLRMHVRAGTLAPVAAVDDLGRIEKLVELAQIARLAAAQLDDFTLELQSLIDHLAAANGKMQRPS